tara:strand:- start:68 stop:493 length:426 start_codon:yes stop_codon:yes gene_type:complete
MAKKPTTKRAVKKVAAKKTTKKVVAKKTPAKKVLPKKVPTKKAIAPKAKIPTKKVLKTSIIARVDVGFGNQLYIRGTGADLSWEKGLPLENVSSYEWAFATTEAKSNVTFKFLINDELWAEGDNVTVAEGATSISSPVFAW